MARTTAIETVEGCRRIGEPCTSIMQGSSLSASAPCASSPAMQPFLCPGLMYAVSVHHFQLWHDDFCPFCSHYVCAERADACDTSSQILCCKLSAHASTCVHFMHRKGCLSPACVPFWTHGCQHAGLGVQLCSKKLRGWACCSLFLADSPFGPALD